MLDEAGARVKLGKSTSYTEIKRIERELKRAVDGMKSALARKDFDEAVAFHDEEVTLRRRHEELKQNYEEECNKILDVQRSDVEDVIARWTGIPIQSVAEEEADKLLQIEKVPARADRRPGGLDLGVGPGDPPLACRAGQPQPADRLVRVSSDRREWARPRSRAPWRSSCSTPSGRWCVSTCPSTWKSTPSPR